MGMSISATTIGIIVVAVLVVIAGVVLLSRSNKK